ncbi:hypothetical protein CDAR_380311 [Caerostris darwini]|uniref:Uncharacterized protein n=1 Tax=Caerostris darwini TaxID=1538125 RepID=A0AAV4TH43_9ARAC|nr:hypothetical protein CDAR_380311 [Caerostris darwini]
MSGRESPNDVLCHSSAHKSHNWTQEKVQQSIKCPESRAGRFNLAGNAHCVFRPPRFTTRMRSGREMGTNESDVVHPISDSRVPLLQTFSRVVKLGGRKTAMSIPDQIETSRSGFPALNGLLDLLLCPVLRLMG